MASILWRPSLSFQASTSENHPSPLLCFSNYCSFHSSSTLSISILDLCPPTLTLAIASIFTASTILPLYKELLKYSFKLQIYRTNSLLGILSWISNEHLTLNMSNSKLINSPTTSSSFRNPCFGAYFPNLGVSSLGALLLDPYHPKTKESTPVMLVTSVPFFPISLFLLKP